MTAMAASKESRDGEAVASSPGAPEQLGVNLNDSAFETLGTTGRYEPGTVIGRGGMGEVRLCRDTRLGRLVAMKVLYATGSATPEPIERFLREARVQGQLEHPSIVPVYDLGLGPDGLPYFTMKRVQGVTLEDVILKLKAGHPDTRRQYSRHKLLTAFGQVCLAVDFAHRHGVIHRDLKPANIMLGGFGEVYVLDWGLAKVLGTEDVPVAAAEPVAAAAPAPDGNRSDRISSNTQAGVTLGTPGFMAPEQVKGGTADARTDVYALGSILFEMLALQPLHEGIDTRKIMEATAAGVDARPSERAPELDIPPELDALCVRATALSPADRYPSARALHDDLERYLEGERDVELRRSLAREHAKEAEAAAERALQGGEASVDERRRALGEVGRALALDSSNTHALMTLVRLLGEPPKQTPPEVQQELAAADFKQAKLTGTIAALGYASLALYIPLLLWMGVHSWGSFAVLYGLMTIAVGVAYITTRKPRRSPSRAFLTLVVSTAMIGAISEVFGPFVLLPGFLIVNALAFSVHLDRRRRPLAVAISLLALIVPTALRVMGVIPSSYRFGPDGEGMTIVPRMADFPETATLTLLFTTTLATAIISAAYVGRIRDALTEAEGRLLIQAWHLKQLVPQDVGAPETKPK